jgi:mannan endo-1,4-beta-mannosidase
MDHGTTHRLAENSYPASQPTAAHAQNGASRPLGGNAAATPFVSDRNTERDESVKPTGQTSPVSPAGKEAVANPQQEQNFEPTINLQPDNSSGSEHIRTQLQTGSVGRRGSRRTVMLVTITTCVVLLIGTGLSVVLKTRSQPPVGSTQPLRYLGVYERDMSGATTFAATTGVKPDVLTYYSSWLEPFQTSFAMAAAEHGAVPLVQINPYNVSLSAIASGKFDGYLSTFAEEVRAYGHLVIMSFGHEMNGNWYPWGYTHTSPAVFVAAWRHIVTVFRSLGAQNAIWLWTVNIMETESGHIPGPATWWPGSSYVTWVGIDGYYYQPSWTFTSLFGPTITAVRELTRDPILIAETGATAGPEQPAKIADLFGGVRLYGLLGFVWFNAKADEDWRLSSPAALAAFHRAASAYYRPQP